MCGKTHGPTTSAPRVRGRLASRSISTDRRGTRLDCAWMPGVCRKTSVDALETRARGPKTPVVGRYMETDRRKMAAGRSTMDTDSRNTWASVVGAQYAAPLPTLCGAPADLPHTACFAGARVKSSVWAALEARQARGVPCEGLQREIGCGGAGDLRRKHRSGCRQRRTRDRHGEPPCNQPLIASHGTAPIGPSAPA